MHRVFLLSPAKASGARAQMLLNGKGEYDLAVRLRRGEPVTLGETFAFLSGLYFRGKLAYAQRFGIPPDGCSGACVITPHRGLIGAETFVTGEELLRFAEVPIDAGEPRFTGPLAKSAMEIMAQGGSGLQVVLLGSIASGKYVDCLLPCCGEQLLFPESFVGRGDMSRGGLLLRAARSGEELKYIPVAGAVRRGVRPAKLEALPKAGKRES